MSDSEGAPPKFDLYNWPIFPSQEPKNKYIIAHTYKAGSVGPTNLKCNQRQKERKSVPLT